MVWSKISALQQKHPALFGWGVFGFAAFFAVSLFSASARDGKIVYTFRPIPAIVLMLTLTFLILAEKRCRLFGSLKNTAIALFRKTEEKPFARVLRVAALLSALLYGTCLLLLYTFSYIDKTTAVGTFALAILTLLLQLFHRISSKQGAEPYRLFLAVALILGSLLAYLMPLCTEVTWDDGFHFGRIWDMATFRLSNEIEPWAIRRLNDYTSTYYFSDFFADPRAFCTQLLSDFELDAPAYHRLDNPLTAIGSLPAILSTVLLLLFGGDLVKILMLGRLAELLVSVFVSAAGIKKLKAGGHLFSAVCLLPGVLFLNVCFGYDCWLTAWAAYTFAYFISLFQDGEKKVSNRDTVLLALGTVIGSLVKQVYFVMFLPLLFIPKSKFESDAKARRHRLILLFAVFFLIVSFIAPMLITSNDGDLRGGEDVSVTGQIKYVLTHPFEYAKTLLLFAAGYLSLDSLLTGVLDFAYLGVNRALWGSIALLALFFATMTDRKEELPAVPKKIKLLGFFCGVVQVLVVITSLYMIFTPVGADTVLGCQRRYLFPVLFPLLYFVLPESLKCKCNKTLSDLVVFGGISVGLTGILLELVLRFL